MKKICVIALSLALASCGSKALKKSQSLADATPIKEETKSLNVVREPEVEVKGNEKIERHVVYFDTNSSSLTSEAMMVLEKQILPAVKDVKSKKITVEGHCDERGSSSYNNKLGKKRAESVKEFFVKSGINSSKIKVRTFGESQPVDKGHDESAWAKNRRAVTVIVKR